MPGVEIALFFVAFLYATVGHAGASGYIAVMTLASFPAPEIRGCALVLNTAVALIGTVKFRHFLNLRLLLTLVPLSVPAAALGGYLALSKTLFSLLLGGVLLFSAAWLLTGKRDPLKVTPPRALTALVAGGLIGVLAGLTGTGGGIFLSPLMLFLGWGTLKETSAAAAPFILVNSISGLLGFTLSQSLPLERLPGYLGCVAAGGYLGATLGSRLKSRRVLQLLLAGVLILAGGKLLLQGFPFSFEKLPGLKTSAM